MLRYVTGDIFESQAQTLVNTVNCRGVMGKGLALQFKLRYPEMFADYVERCQCGSVKIGVPYLYRTASGISILNFPTKDDWRRPSQLDYIEKGLRYFAQHYQDMEIRSIAFPQLGCQNGNLKWAVVKPLMERYLAPLDIDVEIYIYPGSSQQQVEGSRRNGIGIMDLINAARSTEDLRRSLGVSERLAWSILKYREQHGRIARSDHLLNVPGIGKKTYQRILAFHTQHANQRTAEEAHDGRFLTIQGRLL